MLRPRSALPGRRLTKKPFLLFSGAIGRRSGTTSLSSAAPKAKARVPPPAPRPSSSVVVLSPQNQVLLLQRVSTSKSFASAHVFPGGNVDEFHDGSVPPPEDPGRHEDGPAYRMAAVRETFEETGILLARSKDSGGELINLTPEERDAARKRVHGNQVRFADWLDSVGGIPDTDNLLPFTRWITPANISRRFTTQMYLYLLPLERRESPFPSEMLVPTPDAGVEHTAATFAPAPAFLARAAANDIILMPPQAYLLALLARFVGAGGGDPLQLGAQRSRLLSFLRASPTADTDRGRAHWTAGISWADKVISPHVLLVREPGEQVVLGLDRPGPELDGSGRGGDWERVVLVRYRQPGAGPGDVEVRLREDVLAEERAAQSRAKL